MKRILLITFLLVLLVFPLNVVALDIGTGEDGLLKGAAKEAGYDEGTTETTFAATLGQVVKVLMSLAGIIFLSLMVYAGYLWMTARGKEERVEKAQAIIRGSIIGLIIAVGAYSITNFIVPRILESTGGSGSGSAVCVDGATCSDMSDCGGEICTPSGCACP